MRSGCDSGSCDATAKRSALLVNLIIRRPSISTWRLPATRVYETSTTVCFRYPTSDLRATEPNIGKYWAIHLCNPPWSLKSPMLVLGVIHYDSAILGPLLTWDASGAQFILAIALVWIAAHENTPAGRLPRQIVYTAAGSVSWVVVFVTLLTFSTSPANEPLLHVPPWINEMLRVSPSIMGFACGIGSTIAGGILVLFFSWMFRNSLAIRPTIAGALYGAGAGLAINAGWRIACPVDPVACAGSTRSSDHRHSGLRSTHRAFFRKSQIAHRRQTFLSASSSLHVDAETLLAPKKFGQFCQCGRMILSSLSCRLPAERLRVFWESRSGPSQHLKTIRFCGLRNRKRAPNPIRSHAAGSGTATTGTATTVKFIAD